MSTALSQLRTPVNAKALGLVVAALALASGSTIGTVATGSHQSLPSVTTQAPQAPATTNSQDTTSTPSTSSGATTNHANANAFGQQVVQQVKTCKAQAAAAGTHGIGQCVSSWVVKNNPGASHHKH